MEPKRILMFSVLLAVVGMLLSFSYLRKKEAAIVRGMNPVNILVAAKDIPEKTLLTGNMFKIMQIPEKFIEPTSIRVTDIKIDMEKVIDKVNLVPIFAGQQIMQSQLVPPSEETGLSVKVPMGKRAMIIPVANVDMVDLIKPADFVDVLNTFPAKLPGGGSTKVTVTVLQNILVLGVAKDLGNIIPVEGRKKGKKGVLSSSGPRTAASLTLSIAVAPDEAQLIALAQAQGDLYITIRGKNDNEGVLVQPIDTSLFLR